jgi:hypothetical protein
MPVEGEILDLSAQLLDGDTSKFIRVDITDPSGAAIAGSPFSLPHLGGGKYGVDTVLMTDDAYLIARYESFNDPGFTTPDPDHLLGSDKFRLEIPDSVILDRLDTIIEKLQGLALPGAAMRAVLVQNKIAEVIEDVNQAKALVERDSLKAAIRKDSQAVGKLDGNEITGKVEE